MFSLSDLVGPVAPDMVNNACCLASSSKGHSGVNHPAIVQEILHLAFLPAFPHFKENVPRFVLYFGKKYKLLEIAIIFSSTKIFCGHELCKNNAALSSDVFDTYQLMET